MIKKILLNKCQHLIIIVIACACSFQCSAQPKKSLKFNMIDTVVSCEKENFGFTYSFTNLTGRNIKLPEEIIVLSEDQGADIDFLIEEYDNEKKIFSPMRYSRDLIRYREKKTVNLLPRHTLSDTSRIFCYFSNPGKYRMRIRLRFSRYNKWLDHIYSQWIEFRVADVFKLKTINP